MANATSIYIADYQNGAVYNAFKELSGSAWTAHAGYGWSGANWVTAIKFRVSGAANSVTFRWYTVGATGGYADLKYIVTEGENSAYHNATAATDGTAFTANLDQYGVNELTAGGSYKPNTDYVLYLWTARNTSYQSYTSLRIVNNDYPLTVTYTEAGTHTLTRTQGTGSNLSVEVIASGFRAVPVTLSAATNAVYSGETIRVTYSAQTGYTGAWAKYGNTDIASGGTFTVSGSVTVSSGASVQSFTLSISAGTGSNIGVNRTGSPLAGAATGALTNGATIYYSDALQITFGAQTGYTLGTHTVNGSTFASGGTYTVTGAVAVAATATRRTYTLSISAGTGSTVTVKRGGETLTNGATICYSDALQITFGAQTGYTLGTHTVNGSTFASGGTYTVTGAVSVAATATRRTYTLSISAGTGSAVTVKQGGTTLTNGATISYGDVLTIFFTTQTGYTLGTHTVNGSTFASGETYTVTGAVTVVSTATQTVFTLNISQGQNSTITVKRGSQTLTNGSPITYGDVLTISFAAATGYYLSETAVNGSTFASGGTHTVTGNVTVVSAATSNPYSLDIVQGTNTTVTVMRGSERLYDNAVIAYNDVLTISFEAASGYTISTHTVNGTTFTSGNTHTVTGNVTVVSAAVTAGQLTEPTNVSPDEVNGTGAVDVSQGMTISWQVNGNVAMTAYQIDIYRNDAESTLLLSSGRVPLGTPFWGHDYRGEIRYFSTTIASSRLEAAGITNGNEYKLMITQWWSQTNSITQNTASVFVTRGTPALSVQYQSNTGTSYTFAAEYTQAEGVPLNWVRWQIFAGGTRGTTVYDSGVIAGTGELLLNYDGMAPGQTYIIQCSIETAEGVRASASMSYQIQLDNSAPFSGAVTVCPAGESGMRVSWTAQAWAERYSIHRIAEGGAVAWKVADVNAYTQSITDYAAASATPYQYIVYPINDIGTVLAPGISDYVSVQYGTWTILETQQNEDGGYDVVETYRFRMGAGGVAEGNFSNNNSPSVLQNFTRYPLRQASSANYLTGSVSGYIGTVQGVKAYADTVAEAGKLMALAQSVNTLFLADPKGHFLQIQTSAPVSASTNNKSVPMPQTVTIPWVETGTAEGIMLRDPDTDLLAATQISNGRIDASGQFAADDGYRASGLVRITPGAEMTITILPAQSAGAITIGAAFYDENGDFLSGSSGEQQDSGEGVSFAVPPNAAGARVYWQDVGGAEVRGTVAATEAAGSVTAYLAPLGRR